MRWSRHYFNGMGDLLDYRHYWHFFYQGLNLGFSLSLYFLFASIHYLLWFCSLYGCYLFLGQLIYFFGSFFRFFYLLLWFFCGLFGQFRFFILDHLCLSFFGSLHNFLRTFIFLNDVWRNRLSIVGILGFFILFLVLIVFLFLPRFSFVVFFSIG